MSLPFNGPIPVLVEKVGEKIKEGIADIAVDYISAIPIMLGVSIGVYALISMISRRLANLGVVGVFLYGALIVIV